MTNETIMKDRESLRQIRETLDKATAFIIAAQGNQHQTTETQRLYLDDSQTIVLLHSIAYARESICAMENE